MYRICFLVISCFLFFYASYCSMFCSFVVFFCVFFGCPTVARVVPSFSVVFLCFLAVCCGLSQTKRPNVEIGSTLLTGPFHSALGVFTGKAPSQEELKWSAENLHELSEYACTMGITLGLEYLNRFESYLATSSEELISLADRVDHPNCKLMFDTFHANIEEKNMPIAIRQMGKRLVHVQLSENDRSTLGAGHVDFKSILSALDEIGYTGMLSIEAFSPKLSVANIWRKMFGSESQLMKESLEYLNQLRK